MSLPKSATMKQRMMYKYGLKHPYCLICASPRMGKSLVAIALQKKRKVNTLILAPSYLVLNWKKEIIKWNPKANITIFQKGKDIYEVCDTDFVIISYNLAMKAEHLFEWADFLICDEIHNLKNTSAKRSQAIHKFLYENSIKYFVGLTGTPLKNRVREFYSILSMAYYDPRIDEGVEVKDAPTFNKFLKTHTPKILPKYFFKVFPDEIAFAEEFSHRSQFEMDVVTKKGARFRMPIVKYEGLKNLPLLKKWLKGRYIRVRPDVGDLPPFSYKDVLISETNNKKLIASFEAYFSQEGTGSVKPDIKVEAAMKKVPFTINYVDNLLESVDRCLIYSDHKEPITKIAKHFKAPLITGEVSAKKRNQIVSEFQQGKHKVLCATIGSLKEGADLYMAKDLVLNDPCWVSGDLEQVINRMRKLGEKEPRTVHRILGSPQDLKIYEALEYKQSIIDQAT